MPTADGGMKTHRMRAAGCAQAARPWQPSEQPPVSPALVGHAMHRPTCSLGLRVVLAHTQQKQPAAGPPERQGPDTLRWGVQAASPSHQGGPAGVLLPGGCLPGQLGQRAGRLPADQAQEAALGVLGGQEDAGDCRVGALHDGHTPQGGGPACRCRSTRGGHWVCQADCGGCPCAQHGRGLQQHEWLCTGSAALQGLMGSGAESGLSAPQQHPRKAYAAGLLSAAHACSVHAGGQHHHEPGSCKAFQPKPSTPTPRP